MSSITPTPAARTLDDRTIWRSAMYRALALAFSYPDASIADDLRVDLDELCDHELTRETGAFPSADALREALGRTTPVLLAESFNMLFAGDVACSLCETEYDFDGFAKARQLADIAGFYRAFGLKASSSDAGPADSIATECEFMSHIALKDAFAAAQGWHEQRAVAWDAERAFVEDHLGRWVPAFCRSLAALEDVDDFYGAAACLCDAFIAQEIELTGARPLPAFARNAPGDAAEPFTCVYAAPETEGEEAPQ